MDKVKKLVLLLRGETVEVQETQVCHQIVHSLCHIKIILFKNVSNYIEFYALVSSNSQTMFDHRYLH